MSPREELVVHVDDVELGTARIGTVRRARARGKSVISFEYDGVWLDSGFAIDPALSLSAAQHYLERLPGVFADTAPDRWGRVLLERAEAARATQETRRPQALEDWDFMVRVSDGLRMGALRFARAHDGVFIAQEPDAVPPLARLREIEHLAQEVERGAAIDPADRHAALIAPGSSLGGNRPKANFRSDDDRLWIAKFPSTTDRWDVGAWEYVLNRLAARAGIAVPPSKLLGPLASTYRIFAAERFDRIEGGRRLFASALSLAGRRDHADSSYLDIVNSMSLYGDATHLDEDLEELFRRAAFNVLVGHRDDHLRNHGFLRARGGWRIAPAYDLNPKPDMTEHTVALDAARREPKLDIVVATRRYYRVSEGRASEIVDEVRNAVREWRRAAEDVGIPRGEVEVMEGAFSG